MILSKPQQVIFDNTSRFKVVIAGRRFGKTYLATQSLCYYARIPDREVWYVSPSYKMSKQIVWRKLKHRLQDLRWAAKTNESELSILLKNGSTIALKGADNPDSLRGVGLDYLIMDEFADIDSEAWYEVLRPTLSDREGDAMFIGTPKGIANWSYDLFQDALEYPDEWARFQYTTIDGGNVSAREIESAKRSLDIRQFRQEYLATFETYSGRIYYAFDRELNIKELDIRTHHIYIGMDFNVDPMSAVVAVPITDGLYIFDEINIYSSNTDEMVDEIKQRYPKSKITIFPDPAARQRKTSAGSRTDLTILQNAGFEVKCPHHHTPVRDRINAVNARLCSVNQNRNILINPKCKKTIESLERQVYKEGTNVPDKGSGYDHQNDALGYMVDYLYPIKKDIILPKSKAFGHRIS